MQQTVLVYVPSALFLLAGTICLVILLCQPSMRIPHNWINATKTVSLTINIPLLCITFTYLPPYIQGVVCLADWSLAGRAFSLGQRKDRRSWSVHLSTHCFRHLDHRLCKHCPVKSTKLWTELSFFTTALLSHLDPVHSFNSNGAPQREKILSHLVLFLAARGHVLLNCHVRSDCWCLLCCELIQICVIPFVWILFRDLTNLWLIS